MKCDMYIVYAVSRYNTPCRIFTNHSCIRYALIEIYDNVEVYENR